MNTLQDRIRGSLIGGAIGDALGYPVEFMSLQQIRGKYGDSGITRFELNEKAVPGEWMQQGEVHVSDEPQSDGRCAIAES